MADPCKHEWLNEKGRCVECGEWAVLTGQVPARCCPGAGSMVHVRGCMNHPEYGRV